MANFSFCLLLFFFTVASGVEKQPRDGAGTKFDLHDFLKKAHTLGIINEHQEKELRNLALEDGRAPPLKRSHEGEPESYSQAFSDAFLRTYDQFSLLNLLYFSGSLLVMGAFTLFSTLAWTNFGYGGVALILLGPLLLSGFLGVKLWDEGTYPILGGLFCAVSTSLVPFTVYCLQRSLKWWPGEDPGLFQGFRTHVRGGWVVMEIATILTGALFLGCGVRFPFLLFPISWGLWFLSMDLAPFLPEWYRGWRGMWEARRILSLFFGLSMLIIGRLLEARLGSDPDFGFWLYLFGLNTFWFAVTFAFPDYDLHGSLYLLINIAISLAGSHLERTTFHVFATMGVLLYTIGVFSNYIKPEKSFILWVLKALSVVGLFSQALKTGGSIEIVIGLACLVAFSYSFLPFLDSGPLHQTFFLFTSLGFVGCAAAFQRPLNLWLFDFHDASWLVGLASSLCVLLYHARLIKYHFGSPTENLTVFLLHIYRVGVSVCVSVVFIFLRQPAYAWVGGLGIPLIATNFSSLPRIIWSVRREMTEYLHLRVLCLVILIVGVVLSLYVESNILYVVTCTVLLVFIILAQLQDWKIIGCVFSVALVLLSVPLQSRFIMTIGVIYIFIYLTHLAYHTFKNSMLFSLTLIGLGLSIIYLGYLYQSNEALVQDHFDHFTPDFVKILLIRRLSREWTHHSQFDWYYHFKKTDFSYESFMSCPYCWILWPAPLMHALSKGKVPFVSTMVSFGIILLLLAMAISSLRRSFVVDLDSEVKVTSLNIALSREHDNHGVIVKIKGTKPPSLKSSPYVAVDVSGQRFWGVVLDAFGGWKVSFARAMFLPLRLSPHFISFVGFTEDSSEFSATILLGTGRKGSVRLSHRTALDTLAKLKRRDYSSARMTCTLLYSNSWYAPFSKLAEKEMNLGDIVLE